MAKQQEVRLGAFGIHLAPVRKAVPNVRRGRQGGKYDALYAAVSDLEINSTEYLPVTLDNIERDGKIVEAAEDRAKALLSAVRTAGYNGKLGEGARALAQIDPNDPRTVLIWRVSADKHERKAALDELRKSA